ncbi:MFS transporter [Paraflavitalea speifideaquila]|uniref:MFS transporter n=1 Tax=Paraflavitalea speifideaquila TaxID=3076558 RepID=UPI0028E8DEC1|nr:MFS transporter [Paraflavitalea speifideiaquila]
MEKIITTTKTVAQDREADSLPVMALLALAMTGFLALMTETFPAGLLLQIGQGLGVSESLAGQLVTLYAIGSLVSAIPLTAATRGWNRRPLLLTALIGFMVFNLITAFSHHYILTLIVRFLAGMSGGLIWGMLAGYARRMVTDRLKGRSMALAMVGPPLALSFGMPAGTWLGTLMGWENTFIVMSAITLVLIIWVMISVPDYAGQEAGARISINKVLFIPGIRSVLSVIAVWVLAHSMLYTFIVPLLADSGLADNIDLVLLVFGLFALLGIWVAGLLVDRMLRILVLAGLTVFLLAVLALGLGDSNPVVVLIAIALWGFTFGGAPTLLQTASADVAGEHGDVAQAMVVTVWNSAIALGGILGGILLGTVGVGSFPWIAILIVISALVIVFKAVKHGFKPGPRSAK